MYWAAASPNNRNADKLRRELYRHARKPQGGRKRTIQVHLAIRGVNGIEEVSRHQVTMNWGAHSTN